MARVDYEIWTIVVLKHYIRMSIKGTCIHYIGGFDGYEKKEQIGS